MTDVALTEFLASLGLSGPDAMKARAILEEEGITNPRKTRLALAKRDRAQDAIDARLARLCHACRGRVELAGREPVQVRPDACAHCHGSRNTRAIDEMAETCAALGVRRLVVVGGSPDTRRELGALDGRLELRRVDGTERRTRAQADGDLAWADLVVVCGGTELAHRVSLLYTGARTSTPVVTASRRGVEAIAGAVVEHLALRRHRASSS
jgi:hypothetical protein